MGTAERRPWLLGLAGAAALLAAYVFDGSGAPAPTSKHHPQGQLAPQACNRTCVVDGASDCPARPLNDGIRAALSRLPVDGGLKLLLTSDLFDVNDGGSLPELLAGMLDAAPSPNRTAVWLRDGRAGYEDAYVSWAFANWDVKGLRRMQALGISRHVGLWINRHLEEGAPMTLEEDMASNESREVDLESVKALIDSAEVLYVTGGEPFALLRNLRGRTGQAVWTHALGRLREGRLIFLSRSAGTIIAGAHVDVTAMYRSARTIEAVKEFLGDPIDWTGLGLLPGTAVRPHYKPGGMMGVEKRHLDNRANWSHDDFIEHLNLQRPDILAVPIVDGDFISVNHGEVRYGNPCQ